jgi:hypothetical protein
MNDQIGYHEDLQFIVDHQAEMSILWPNTPSFVEGVMMAALRHLHAVIEGDRETAARAKRLYWELVDES